MIVKICTYIKNFHCEYKMRSELHFNEFTPYKVYTFHSNIVYSIGLTIKNFSLET